MRQGDVADMELEVELRILDPVGVVEIERHGDQLLAETTRKVQPALDVAQNALERHLAAGRRRLVVDREGTDVRRRARCLEVKERRVHAAELLHVYSPARV